MSASKRPSSRLGSTLFLALLIATGGGAGYYYYDMQLKGKAERERIAALNEAHRQALIDEERRRMEEEESARLRQEEEEARRQQEEEELARRRKAEEEARLLEEKARRERLAADEAERLRKLQEEVQQEPEETPEEPAQPVYTQELVLIGSSCNQPSNTRVFDDMVNQMLDKGDFEQFAADMAGKIRACAPELVNNGKMSYSTYRNSKVLADAIDLCLLIEMTGNSGMRFLVKPEEMGESLVDAAAGKLFMRWMLDAKPRPLHNLLRSFEANEGQGRNMSNTLRTLYGLWCKTPEKEREKYLNLALACSLLNPQAANAPSQLRQSPGPTLTVPEVYDYFREMDAKGKLLTDVKKMSVSNLLYVVDVRLPRSEFDWVQKNLKYKQENWGEAYGSIRYLMERATHNKDPYKTYSFAELREEGGVCRDQGYFACNTAKCKGIPAVYIVGDGDRGPHAWIGSMVDEVTWQQTGSYGYNTGRFGNPCSGRAQHESVLLSRDKKTTDEKLAAAADGMIVSDYLSRIGCTAEAWGAAAYVTSAFPRLTAAWGNRLKVLTADENNLPDEATWKKLNIELTRLSHHNAELLDFAAEIESTHLLKGKSAIKQRRAMDTSLKKLSRNLDGERSDLLMDAVNRQAKLMVEGKDFKALAALYKKQLKDNTRRGDVFQQLIGSYVHHLNEMDAPQKAWATCAKEVESIFKKKVLSETGDYFKLTKEVAIQMQIAEIYRKAGDNRKADKLRDEAEERLQESKEQYKED